MNHKKDNVEFDNEQETEFYYSMIDKCNALMQRNSEIMCCKQHGILSNKRVILNCNNEDSFAVLMKRFLLD